MSKSMLENKTPEEKENIVVPPTTPLNSRRWQKKLIIVPLIILITVVILLSLYLIPKEKDLSQQSYLPQLPEPTKQTLQKNPTTEPLTNLETQSTRSLVIEEYDSCGNNCPTAHKFVLLDFQNLKKITISNFTDPIALTQSEGIPTNLKGNPYFYFIKSIKSEPEGKTILFKSDLTGKVMQNIPLAPNWIGLESVAISKNGNKIAWCIDQGDEKYFVWIYDSITNSGAKISDPLACDKGSIRFTFSQDSSKLYYYRGFYEMHGDFTEEEYKKLSQENENGLHLINLASQNFSLIKPEAEFNEFVFWDDPTINFETKIVLRSRTNALEIKRLINTNFDYLTDPEIQQLESLDIIEVPGKYFLNSILTEDGKGVFYNLTDKQASASNQIGYYDLESKTNFFPLPNVESIYQYVSLFAALDKNHLFYLGGRKMGNDPTSLYQTDYQGNNRLVEKVTGTINLISVVKN